MMRKIPEADARHPFPFIWAIRLVGVLGAISCIGLGLFALQCSRLLPVVRLHRSGATTDGLVIAFGQRHASLHVGKSAMQSTEPAITFKYKDDDGRWREKTIWIDAAWDEELKNAQRRFPRAYSLREDGWNRIRIRYLSENPEAALPERAMRVGIGNLVTALLLLAAAPLCFYVLTLRSARNLEKGDTD